MNFRFWPSMAFLAVLLFSLEVLFLPLAGIQADEVLFVTPFLKGAAPLYSWHVGSIQIPVMIMDYIGALKTWLYAPLFSVWPPGVWSIRLPPCLVSIATLVVFADAARRVAGESTALLAVLFLATDAPFVLTNVYDWGPVSLLLLGTVSCVNLFIRYGQSGSMKCWCAAFLVAGIATWYKAIFIFPFMASLAAIAIFNVRKLRGCLPLRHLAAAASCFAIGLSPLVVFNFTHLGATLSAATHLDSASLHEKVLMMHRTLDGRALEHYMFRSFRGEKIALSGAPLADLIATWYRQSGLGPGSLLPWLLLLSIPALYLVRRSENFRHLLCVWFACACLFGVMLVFRNAGAGPHHTVLIDPGPQFIVAATLVSLAQLVRRPLRFVVAAAGLALVVSNLYLLDRYYSAARDNGFSVYWTAAERPLSREIQARNQPTSFLDWGIRDVVRVETADRISLASDEPRERVLYVGHCEDYVVDAGQTANFERKLSQSGLHRTQIARVPDQQGTSMFCLSMLGR